MRHRHVSVHQAKTDRDYLRQVTFGDSDAYCLRTWDTNRRAQTGQWLLGYELVGPDGHTLFSGTDFGTPCAIDANDSLRTLIGFLTLKPGDTEDDYFEDYTPEQMAFAEGDAEDLSLWSLEADNDFLPPRFHNIDDWEDEMSPRERRFLHRQMTMPHARCRPGVGRCVEHDADSSVPSCCARSKKKTSR